MNSISTEPPAEAQLARTLWIGRDAQGAHPWIEAAHSIGWRGRPLPLIERQALAPNDSDALVLDQFQTGDWVFLTSPAAVKLGLCKLLEGWPVLAEARFAIVGPGTKAAWEKLQNSAGRLAFSAPQLQADGRGGMALAVEFLKQFGSAGEQARPLYWLRAQQPRPELAAILQGAGWPLHSLAVYRTQGVAGPTPVAGQLVLLFSPSGARALRQRIQNPQDHPILALGSTTAAAAVDLGFRVRHQLSTPQPQALLDSLG
jgi:uroporphyrinogen-III synthase